MDNKKEQPKRDNIQKITGVLHGQKKKLDKIEQDLQDQHRTGEKQDKKLNNLLAKTERLSDEVGVTMSSESQSKKDNLVIVNDNSDVLPAISWDDLFEEYEPIDGDNLLLDDLLPSETIARIDAKFDAPLKRTPWNKIDYYIVFGAALTGIITDWFCAPIGNPLSKKILSYGEQLHDKGGVEKAFREFQNKLQNSDLAERFPWVNKFAEMQVSHDNLPIDYSGKKYGGRHHRILSGGHDLLRFMSAIWQIKNGQFVGKRYEYGKAMVDVINVSHKGNVYIPRKDWSTAAVEYFLHIIADFFTETSLPVPGATLLREIPNREVRKFIAENYKSGYNLRHVIGQSVTPAVTSLIVWLYYLLRYRIGNWMKVHIKKETIEKEPVPGLKFNEMLAVAHTIVTGVNVGRVIITQNPLMLNLTELLIFLKTILGLAIKNHKRYNHEAIYERNKIYLDDGWTRVETFINQPLIGEIALPEKVIILS